MSDVTASVEAVEDVRPVELSADLLDDLLDDQLIGQLVDRARASGLQLTGEGGLLQQLTKRVLESALEGEITDHLGYDKHDPAGVGSGNSRNGIRTKTVLTDDGPVEIAVPRDRDGSFEPQMVKKRQRRLTGVDEMVLSLSARGLTAPLALLRERPRTRPRRHRRRTHPPVPQRPHRGRQHANQTDHEADAWPSRIPPAPPPHPPPVNTTQRYHRLRDRAVGWTDPLAAVWAGMSTIPTGPGGWPRTRCRTVEPTGPSAS